MLAKLLPATISAEWRQGSIEIGFGPLAPTPDPFGQLRNQTNASMFTIEMVHEEYVQFDYRRSHKEYVCYV